MRSLICHPQQHIFSSLSLRHTCDRLVVCASEETLRGNGVFDPDIPNPLLIDMDSRALKEESPQPGIESVNDVQETFRLRRMQATDRL